MRQIAWLARGTRSRWTLARVLACVGALLLVVAIQLPWIVLLIGFPGAPDGTPSSFPYDLSGATFPFLLYRRLFSDPRTSTVFVDWSIEVIWTGALLAGILLALALWQRSSSRLLRLTKAIFRGWLVAVTALAGVAVWVFLTADPFAGSGSNGIVEDRGVGAGFWLVVAALTLLWVGVALMVGEPGLPERASWLALEPRRRRTPAQYVALATLLVGMLLWGIGYLAVPWATANCAPRLSLTHYVDGACAGLDSGDTLMAFVAPHLSPNASLYANSVLLLAFVLLYSAAPLLLLGAGRHAYTRGFCGWVLAWLVVATAMALLSYRGVSAAVANPPFAVGPWHGDVGIVLTLAGLLCAWVSLLPLEAAGLAFSRSLQQAADTNRTFAVDASGARTF